MDGVYPMQRYLAKAALLPNGWADNVLLTIDDTGHFHDVQSNAEFSSADDMICADIIIPAMPNLHSHAFQRAFAGQSEFSTAAQDSFWTWRSLMYDFAQTLDAPELERIATALYKEMRAAGYSHVGEFHYIHHAPDGTAYDDPAALSHAMIRAAQNAGIGITLLPVLYAHSGFGAKPPLDGQKRFIHSAATYIDLITSLHQSYQNDPMVVIGAAFHSLRAVSPALIAEVTPALKSINPKMPIHIHIAEQTGEVDDCLAWSGKRPVAWLLENADVDKHWCLVHATHMDAAEIKALAQSGAVVGLCPITEANLGDGFFPFEDYIQNGGKWGVGSDSHISINMIEELRLLEYGQRLNTRRRAIARSDALPHVGHYLYANALSGGAQALGANTAALETGRRADFLTLHAPHDCPPQYILDHLIFSGRAHIKDSYVKGEKYRAETT
jgi:formimidoylglutamate deiminase